MGECRPEHVYVSEYEEYCFKVTHYITSLLRVWHSYCNCLCWLCTFTVVFNICLVGWLTKIPSLHNVKTRLRFRLTTVQHMNAADTIGQVLYQLLISSIPVSMLALACLTCCTLDTFLVVSVSGNRDSTLWFDVVCSVFETPAESWRWAKLNPTVERCCCRWKLSIR